MTDYTIYRLFDYGTGLYVGDEFYNIREFFDYHQEHTFTPHYNWIEFYDPRHAMMFGTIHYIDNFPTHRIGIFRSRYAIKDAYGANYADSQELYRLAHPSKFGTVWWGGRWIYNWEEPSIFPPKSNTNKLKTETWSWFYRGVQTANEIRQNSGHVNEHGQNMVRAKRRRFNLPTSWDDRPNSRWGTRKSWKHNSKRKHQWLEK